jgi:hypothetical protein
MSGGRQASRDAAGSRDDGSLVPESWGLVLRSGGHWRTVWARLVESILGVIGVGLGLMAVSLWILPGALLSQEVLSMKAVLTTVLAMGGILLLRFANQGLCTEVHLDRLRGEIRIVARNRAQRLRLIDCMTFADIDRVELEEGDDDQSGGPARLVLYLRGSGERVLLVGGPVARLAQVRDLIDLDLSRARRVADAPSGDLTRLIPGLA